MRYTCHIEYLLKADAQAYCTYYRFFRKSQKRGFYAFPPLAQKAQRNVLTLCVMRTCSHAKLRAYLKTLFNTFGKSPKNASSKNICTFFCECLHLPVLHEVPSSGLLLITGTRLLRHICTKFTKKFKNNPERFYASSSGDVA